MYTLGCCTHANSCVAACSVASVQTTEWEDCMCSLRGVTVSTLDSESSNRGSNPREGFTATTCQSSFASHQPQSCVLSLDHTSGNAHRCYQNCRTALNVFRIGHRARRRPHMPRARVDVLPTQVGCYPAPAPWMTVHEVVQSTRWAVAPMHAAV